MRAVGFCHGCGNYDREVEARPGSNEKTLCDRCFERQPMLLRSSPIYGNDTLSTPPRERPKTPAPTANDTRTRTRTRGTSVGKENSREEPQLVKGPTEPAEVDELLRQHRARKIEPSRVVLRGLPMGSSFALERVREDFALVVGLRRAVDDARPVPYGCEWAANRLELSKRHVARLLQQLVELEVIRHVGNMPGRGKGSEGTRLYEPC